MKKILAMLLTLALVAAVGISAYAYTESLPKEPNPPSPTPESETVSLPETEGNAIGEAPEQEEDAASFPGAQDEIIYKMLNSVDYYTTAQVSFSALFPGFDVTQEYTIETNLDTGVSHQTCSDNFIQTRSADTREAYETYSDGTVVREYNNLDRTVRNLCAVEERRSLEEEWPGAEDRYFIDENGDPHYRYRSNPTNSDMAGECLFPQVSAFAYLMDKDLWEIAGTTEYCGRECYSVEGTVNESYSEQIGADTFQMYVDRETGILLKLEARDGNGATVSSMTVSEISIDAPTTRSSFSYDMSKYEGYTELTA